MAASSVPLIQKVRIGRVLILLFFLIVFAFALASLSLKTGYPNMTWNKVLHSVVSHQGSELEQVSVREIRLPRLVLASVAGAMLALAGVLLQDSLKNPLAGPELLGVSAGASFVMALITVLHLSIAFALHPLFSLIGGLIGGGFVLFSAKGRSGSVNFILIGAAVTAIMNGLVVWIITMGTQNDTNLLFTYLLGSLANRNWSHVEPILPWAIIGIPAALCFARPLNVLRLGDETAEGLGMHVARMRFLMLLVCGGLVAAVVAQCGPIGYIALIAPHATRFILQTADARLVLPFSAIMGADLLIGADFLAKTVFMPQEVPVGLWTTLLGGPLLIVLFMKSMRRRRDEIQI